jgi:50S ribosomal subunit-associated GTPase HflX
VPPRYKIHNCEVVIREDASIDQLIDVIQGNRKYLRCLYVYNKCDVLTIEEVDRVSRLPDSVVISCQWDLNLDFLLDKIWECVAKKMGLRQRHKKKRRKKRERKKKGGGEGSAVVLADHQLSCPIHFYNFPTQKKSTSGSVLTPKLTPFLQLF